MESNPPFANLTFDEIKPGDLFRLGDYEMTREEVIAFAVKYDPQPYHLDDEAATANPLFGKLSASGWQTALAIVGMLDRFWKNTAAEPIAGSGVEEIRWIRPAYPGDTLSGTLQILAARPSNSKPNRGVMTFVVLLTNQSGEDVARMKMTAIFSRAAAIRRGIDGAIRGR